MNALRLAVLALVPLLSAPIAAADSVAFVGVTVVDVAAGKPVPGQTVVVADGKIAAVGPAGEVKIPDGATVVKGEGKFLIPGLWDMHTHIADESYLTLFLANGVTGVREMHAFFAPVVLGMRDAVASGKKLGPRIVAAGALVDGPQPVWPGALKTKTPDDGREAVRKLKTMKVDFVKVYSSLTPDVYRAIVDEANKQGLPVAGHCPEMVSIAEASDAGQRSIEHLMGLLVATSREEEALRKEWATAMEGKDKLDFLAMARVQQKAEDSHDPEKAKALYAKLVKNQTWQCPTLVVMQSISGLAPEARWAERDRYMTPFVRNMWKTMISPGAAGAFKARYPGQLKMLAAMHKAGVPILAGTDCTNPHTYPGFSLPDELELLVGCGLTPADALRTATLNPAKFLGEERTAGTVAAGKRADLVLLDADPLADIANVRKITGVVAGGRYLTGAELKKMLTDVAAKFGASK